MDMPSEEPPFNAGQGSKISKYITRSGSCLGNHTRNIQNQTRILWGQIGLGINESRKLREANSSSPSSPGATTNLVFQAPHQSFILIFVSSIGFRISMAKRGGI